jgi:hypothetical protein
MRYRMSLMTTAVALIGCMAAAVAQAPNTSNQGSADPSRPGMSMTPGQDAMHLTQDQRNSVMQGLRDQQKQAAPANFDGQVGSKVPNSMQTQSVPNDVTAQVPETQGLLFVKLPDRVLLIDPNSKAVLEIVADISQPDSSGGGSNTQGSGTGTNR